jgi:hypothetical protein
MRGCRKLSVLKIVPHNLFKSAKFDWRAEKNIITRLFLLAHALRVSQSTSLAQRVYYENQKRMVASLVWLCQGRILYGLRNLTLSVR